MLELHSGRDNGVVDNRVTDDLAGSRATEDRGASEVATQLVHEVTRLNQRSAAEDENYSASFNSTVWQIRLPTITWRPLVLGRFHDFYPIANKEDKAPPSLVSQAGYSVPIRL
jgi:hypothetical protein